MSQKKPVRMRKAPLDVADRKNNKKKQTHVVDVNSAGCELRPPDLVQALAMSGAGGSGLVLNLVSEEVPNKGRKKRRAEEEEEKGEEGGERGQQVRPKKRKRRQDLADEEEPGGNKSQVRGVFIVLKKKKRHLHCS